MPLGQFVGLSLWVSFGYSLSVFLVVEGSESHRSNRHQVLFTVVLYK